MTLAAVSTSRGGGLTGRRTPETIRLSRRQDLNATSILWRRLDLSGHEACRLFSKDGAWALSGTAVFAFEGQGCRLQYEVECDATWRTRSATVSGWIGAEPIDVAIRVDANHQWWCNDDVCPDVEGCDDVDLNFSPSTNLLPIRRLALRVGENTEVRAAWLRFPSFRLEPLVQSYRRLDETTYRFESDGGRFAAELRVNAAGFVTTYGDLWRTEAIT